MSSIDPTGRLLIYLRQQTQEWKRQHPAGAAAAAARGGSALSRSVQQASVAISALDRDDPQARRQAFRLFLQAVLRRELGAGVADDPAFPVLVQRVQDTMEADAELQAAIEQAGELLLRKSAPR